MERFNIATMEEYEELHLLNAHVKDNEQLIDDARALMRANRENCWFEESVVVIE